MNQKSDFYQCFCQLIKSKQNAHLRPLEEEQIKYVWEQYQRLKQTIPEMEFPEIELKRGKDYTQYILFFWYRDISDSVLKNISIHFTKNGDTKVYRKIMHYCDNINDSETNFRIKDVSEFKDVYSWLQEDSLEQ
jgi:hypothetical protein